MLVRKARLPNEITEIFESRGIKKFNEPQQMAIESGILEGENIVVASPTASGKTIIAELAFVKKFLEKSGKTVYVVPLKALAMEKYDEFKVYEKIGMRIAVSIGDYDSSDEWLEKYDLIICTSEKLDSILRHNPTWTRDIALIIIDEIHLLSDMSRGPTLEVVITRLRNQTRSQILALSATISNAEEISQWLNAKLVKSNYRPIKLEKGIFFKNKIDFGHETIEINDTEAKPKDDLILLVQDTIKRKKQSLIFLSSRRAAESVAEKLGNEIGKMIKNKEELEKISRKILNVLTHPTKQCKRLARCVKNGIAFHHAGLAAMQRKIIEDYFRKGLIKIITATPTLAMGVNLPAWRVIIRDVKRYSGSFGYSFISILEIQQMCGRAGRPKYDKEGQAILIAKNEDEIEKLRQRYIISEAEPVLSKLSVEPTLRMHILALIADHTCSSDSELFNFFDKTFFGYQYGSKSEIKRKIDEIIYQLRDFGFVEFSDRSEKSFIKSSFIPAFNISTEKRLSPTRIGRRVAQLYIDPITAKNIIDRTKRIKKDLGDFALVDIISDSVEMYPPLNVKTKEYEDIESLISKKELYRELPELWDIEYQQFLESFKLSLLLGDWMNEMGEDKILEKYGIPPGILYQKLRNAEWLLYAAQELAKVMKNRKAASLLNRARMRIRYGVRSELFPLIRIKNIGRVRARLLFDAGVKTVADIKKAPKQKLIKILGNKLTDKILEEVKS